MATTNYYKKYGIMCCIVLKRYYLCVIKVSEAAKPGLTKEKKQLLKRIKLKVMKKQSNNNFTQVSKEHTNELTTVVNENLAVELLPAKSFTSFDLWDIQRRGRTMMHRRHIA